MDMENLKRLNKLKIIGFLDYELEEVGAEVDGDVLDNTGYKLSIECEPCIDTLDLGRIEELYELQIVFKRGTERISLILPKKVRRLEMVADRVTFSKVEGLERIGLLGGRLKNCIFEDDMYFKDIVLIAKVIEGSHFKGKVTIYNVSQIMDEYELEYYRLKREIRPYLGMLFSDCTVKEVYIGGDNWISGVTYDTVITEYDKESGKYNRYCKFELTVDEKIVGYVPYMYGLDVKILGNDEGKLQLGEDNYINERYADGNHTMAVESSNLHNANGIRHLIFCSNTYIRSSRGRFSEMGDLEIVEIHIDNVKDRLRFPNLKGSIFNNCDKLRKIVFSYVGENDLVHNLDKFAEIVKKNHIAIENSNTEIGSIFGIFQKMDKKGIQIEIEFNGEKKVMGDGYTKDFYRVFPDVENIDILYVGRDMDNLRAALRI